MGYVEPIRGAVSYVELWERVCGLCGTIGGSVGYVEVGVSVPSCLQ